jgi:RNA polymerase sigma-70 factor (ECF subfamily)
MNPTDEELMKAYQMGDAKAFDRLYQRSSGKLFAYLKRRLPRVELAEECFQMVFSKFHRLRHRYDPAYSVEQWLYVIVRSTLTDYFRKNLREVDLDPNALIEEVGSADGLDTDYESLHEVIKKLPEDQRQIVELRTLNELSYREIADRLGKSESNARQLFSRVVRKLKATVSPSGGRL